MWLTDWVAGWLTNWLTNRLTELMTAWLANWLTDWLTYRLADLQTGWLTDWIWMNDSLSDWNVATSKIGVKHLSICFPVSDCRQWLLEALPYVYKEEVFELISEKIKTLELDSGRAVSLIRGLALTPNPTEKMCLTVVVRKKAYALDVCATKYKTD